MTEEDVRSAKRTIPWLEFTVRVCWIAIQVILIVLIGRKGILFFYQNF